MNGDCEVVRIEETLDKNDNPEVFCVVQFENSEYGMLTFAHWLTKKELANYSDNKTDENMESLMAKYYVTAKINKKTELAAIAVEVKDS